MRTENYRGHDYAVDWLPYATVSLTVFNTHAKGIVDAIKKSTLPPITSGRKPLFTVQSLDFASDSVGNLFESGKNYEDVPEDAIQPIQVEAIETPSL